ncbi:MAG: site-2 protease family protein [Kiritimatiellae bacterium]|nr:site-2 protease family protein [Kiritimatiellia bacterium]
MTALYIVACVLLFALAIVIHEFGHFIVALKLGLRVEAFSVGFGPILWKRKVNGVEYRLSAIPLGGYVSIPDVDPEGTKALEGVEEREKEEGEGNRERIPAWKEILVAVAGPGMNVVLAVVLAVLLALVPSAKFGELSSEIGSVIPDGPAAAAGMAPGDVVTSVGGRAVRTWTEMQTEVQISGGKTVEFVVARPGSADPMRLQIAPKRDDVTGAWYIMALSVTNATGAAAWMPNRSPLRQLAWDAGSIFRVLKGLVTPREAKATSQALGGPVMIAEGLYRQVRRDPWDGIGFLRFLNVNLAILNLLPIPVLDGGLILFSLIALVFRRRLPDVVVKYSTLTFMVLLIGLMGLLIVRDSWRSYKIHTYKPDTAENVHTNSDTNAEGR